MERKKFWGKLLALGLVLMTVSGCAQETAKPKAKVKPTGKIVELKSEKEEDLVPLAKAEGKVVIYSVTGRVAKAAVDFEKKYGIKVERSFMGDSDLIGKIDEEIKNKDPKADFVICQDAGRIWGELLLPGYLENYVPEDLKSVIPKENQKPLVFAHMNKVFMYNSETYPSAPITNVWQLTDPALKGRFTIKDPMHEGINLNFLIMLTSPENAAKLEAAYVNQYKKDLELTTPNAGYEWIKRAYANGIVLGTSDTSLTESIGIRGVGSKNIGLLNFSKIRFAEKKNLALGHTDRIAPFTGFYYPEYALIVKGAKHPAAAKLFIQYILTQEGFKHWQDDMGTYSGNKTLSVARGDKPLSQWQKVLIGGNPEYIYEHREEMIKFLKELKK